MADPSRARRSIKDDVRLVFLHCAPEKHPGYPDVEEALARVRRWLDAR
jgi:hypothetical protein